MLDVAGEVAPETLPGIGSVVALRPKEVPLLGEAGCNSTCVYGSMADLVGADDGDFSMVFTGE